MPKPKEQVVGNSIAVTVAAELLRLLLLGQAAVTMPIIETCAYICIATYFLHQGLNDGLAVYVQDFVRLGSWFSVAGAVG